MIHGERETKLLQIGNAAHAAVFTPSVFAERFIELPDFGTMKSPTNRERRDLFVEAEAEKGNQVVPAEEYRKAVAIRDAINSDPLASELMFGGGINEVSIVWDQGGMRCKGRIDRICTFRGRTVVVDLKSTVAPWPGAFEREAVKWQYPAQLATYHNALNILGPAKRRAAFVAVQNDESFEPGIFWMSERDLKRYAQRFASWLQTHKRCSDAGVWPSANPDGTELEIPGYLDRDLSDVG